MAKHAEYLNQAIQSIRNVIFGENNTRLDYLIESFYKLRYEVRSRIIVGSIFFGILFFISMLLVYFFTMASLQDRLDESYENVNKLKNIKSSYVAINQNFEELTQNIYNNNSNLSLITVLEQKAKDMSIQAQGFPNKPVLSKYPGHSPLQAKFQIASVEFKLMGVSIKKIIEFSNAVEQLPNKLKISKFRLLSTTDAKLYFDVLLTVEAIVPIN